MTPSENRLEALTLTDRNIVVEAGAGTGKTTLLIARLCISLLVQHIPAEKLVALTFTDKAAAEIKTRLLEQLQQVIADVWRKVKDAQAPEPEFDETAVPDKKTERTLYLIRTYFPKIPYKELLARAETAKTNLDRAGIGTIHAFCAELLKLFPLEAGISPDANIDGGQTGTAVFEALWNTFLDNELGEQAPQREMWKKVFPEISLTDLETFARELCKGKIEHYDYYAKKELLIKFCEDSARKAAELSSAYLPASKKTPRAIEKGLLWAAQSLRRTVKFLQTGRLTPADAEELPQVPKSSATASTKITTGWEPEAWEEARAIIAFALKVRPEEQDLFLTAYNLVRPLIAQVRAQYDERGILSFDDLLIKTRNLLRDNMAVRRELKEKFSALFIDEFQDTDPVQGEILLFLAEEKISSARSWQEVKLAQGKLFVVGDPKQSIYHFRGADITAYELFTDLILKQQGKKCFLSQNHRSLPEIIDTANGVCKRAMQEEPQFQPPYVPIYTAKEVRNQAVEWLFITPAENASTDDYRHNQAEIIARWIKQQVGQMKLQNGQLLTYKDIALLARTNTNMSTYMDALRRYQIPFNVEQNCDFLREQAVNDFIMLLRTISNPQDKTALAGVLRSPFGGFSDEELYQVVSRGELFLYAATQDEKLQSCYKQLRALADLSGRSSVEKLLTYILDETFFPEACARAYEGENTLGCLKQFVHLVHRYPAEQGVSLETFIADAQTLQDKTPDNFDVPSFDEALDAVSLLSIHKSKGLEAPVVVLCDLSRQEKANKADKHLYSWKYDIHGIAAGKICDINLAFLEEEKKKHNRCEEVRVLYVALTRAKEKLLLVGDGRAKAEKNAKEFAAAGLFPDSETHPEFVADDALKIPVVYSEYQPPETFIYQVCAPNDQAAHTLAIETWKEAYALRRDKYEELQRDKKQLPSGDKELLSPAQRTAAELGTICHRVLERLLNTQNPDLAQLCAAAAAEAGVLVRADEAHKLLTPFTQSELFARLRTCRVLACEMPFSAFAQDGTLETGVMDAVLEKADGSIWVIDYKTDRLRAGNEQKVLQKKYARQLGIYKQAAQKIFAGKQVVASAVFIRTATAADL